MQLGLFLYLTRKGRTLFLSPMISGTMCMDREFRQGFSLVRMG